MPKSDYHYSLPKYVVESVDLFAVVKPLVAGPEKDKLYVVISDFGNGKHTPTASVIQYDIMPV